MTDIQHMINTKRDPEVLKAKLNLETAQVPWHELQRFFANGSIITVASDLDITEVALQISLDSTTQIEQWMSSGQLGKVNNIQALTWFEENTLLWTCVVKPWVLVQDKSKECEEKN